MVRELLSQDTQAAEGRILSKYLKPDMLINDHMGLQVLPQKSGEIYLEIIMRRYENPSTMMTSNRPIEEWGKLLNDVPAASAILDRLAPSCRDHSQQRSELPTSIQSQTRCHPGVLRILPDQSGRATKFEGRRSIAKITPSGNGTLGEDLL
jgi:hypothetical protein